MARLMLTCWAICDLNIQYSLYVIKYKKETETKDSNNEPCRKVMGNFALPPKTSL